MQFGVALYSIYKTIHLFPVIKTKLKLTCIFVTGTLKVMIASQPMRSPCVIGKMKCPSKLPLQTWVFVIGTVAELSARHNGRKNTTRRDRKSMSSA
jgi:hypothetical protein